MLLCTVFLVTGIIPAAGAVLQYDVSNTRDVIDRRGLPDYRVPAETRGNEYLLLYDTSDTSDGEIDYAYLVNEDEQIEERIIMLEEGSADRKKSSRSRDNWFRETVEDLRETVKSIKETRDEMNRSVHTLPLFNQFDEIDVIDDDMKFRLGRKDDAINTTLVYEPRRDWVSLTFRMPFGH